MTNIKQDLADRTEWLNWCERAVECLRLSANDLKAAGLPYYATERRIESLLSEIDSLRNPKPTFADTLLAKTGVVSIN